MPAKGGVCAPMRSFASGRSIANSSESEVGLLRGGPVGQVARGLATAASSHVASGRTRQFRPSSPRTWRP